MHQNIGTLFTHERIRECMLGRTFLVFAVINYISYCPRFRLQTKTKNQRWGLNEDHKKRKKRNTKQKAISPNVNITETKGVSKLINEWRKVKAFTIAFVMQTFK